MEIQTGALVIVLAYMVGMMVVGYVVGKINIKGSADYLVAGRRMGLFMVAFSLSANNIGGGSTTGLATPCSTVVQVLLCLLYYAHLARREKLSGETAFGACAFRPFSAKFYAVPCCDRGRRSGFNLRIRARP